MRSLNSQFLLALKKIYGVEDKNYYSDSLTKIEIDNLEQVRLRELISDFSHKQELIDIVSDQLSEGSFKLGDKAEEFFKRCADKLFLKNLAENGKILPYETVDQKMKRLHPLWGKSW